MTDFAETAPVDAATTPSEGRRLGAGARTYLYVSLILVAAIVLVPLIATALGGFKTLGDLRANPFGLPSVWMWSNYTDILVSQRYWLQMGNSLWIAVLTVILTLALSGMAAFVFAHVKFFGSDYLLNYFLIGLMFPAATAILPLFIRIRDLGLLDTYMGVVLPQVAFHLGVSHPAASATTSATSRPSSSTPPSSTAAATSASSGTSPCRSRGRSSPPSGSSRSWRAGTATSSR